MSLSIGTTDAKLCSAALVLLATKPITALTDESDRAKSCATLYPVIRNRLMAIYGWKFTKSKIQLNRDTTAPISEWTYAYGLPTDRMGEAILELFPTSNVGEAPISRYEIHGNRVLTEETEVWADYQHDVAESEFPPHFQQLLIYALASDLAEPVTDSQTKANYWRGIAFGRAVEEGMGGYFRQARRADSTGQPGPQLRGFSLVDVRF